MKIFFLVLGILFTLASESYSNDRSEQRLDQKGFKSRSEPEKRSSRLKKPPKVPEWLWANNKSLSPTEQIYLDIDTEAPVENWMWGDGKQLTSDENAAMPQQLTFPNWIQGTKEPISPAPEEVISLPAREEVFLSADHMTHDNKRHSVWAWGKVVIKLKDRVIYADKVKINNETGNGKAIGHVIITRNDGTRLKAQKALFNIKNKKGKLFETRGKLGEFFYKGKGLTRHSEKHYTAQKAHLTTCQGKLPDWVFEAESMDILVGDRALFNKGVFKVKGVPVLYFPIGYIPINQDRKSGFLMPSFGNSEVNGPSITNTYYWAIDESSDATFILGYMGKRGFSPELEYRYKPSSKTFGVFNYSFIEDKVTRSTFWKLDATHQQILPFDFKFDGTLDLEGKQFNRNFDDSTVERARRNSDSHANITKNWETSSLDILTRFRDSTDQSSDQTFAELPEITYKTQRNSIGDTDFYFNQDSTFTSFLTDLNTDPEEDDKFSVQRFDFHPQVSYTMKVAPWLSLTPILGIRETLYSKGLDTADNNKRLDFFTRESFDITAQLEGPRFQKIFSLKNKRIPKVKHLIEPRITYNFIPDIDERDRKKIKVLDGIDNVNQRSQLTYALTQRVLQKEHEGGDNFSTREVLRFDISQSLDLIEATGSEKPEDKRPLSDIRFDLDSRLLDAFEFNADTTFDIYGDRFETWNFEVGLKPIDSLFLFLERRYIYRGDVSTVASIDWTLNKSWSLQASTRLDENTDTNRENYLSIVYDNPCKCWGFNFDMIKRRNFNTSAPTTNETKFFFGLTLRGLGAISSGKLEKSLHRKFKSIKQP